jgi:hypothetical protein
MSKTAVQTKAVRNRRRRMSVRGKTANWTPPKKTRRTKLQAKELPKLLSASRWYCTTMEKTVPAKVIDIENNKINSMDRWTYLFLFE